jgi:hypothetical protein
MFVVFALLMRDRFSSSINTRAGQLSLRRAKQSTSMWQWVRETCEKNSLFKNLLTTFHLFSLAEHRLPYEVYIPKVNNNIIINIE